MATEPKSSPFSSLAYKAWIFFFASASPDALLFCRLVACEGVLVTAILAIR